MQEALIRTYRHVSRLRDPGSFRPWLYRLDIRSRIVCSRIRTTSDSGMLVESSRIAAKGFETLGQEAAEYSRKSFESATAAMKTLATVKSPTEFFKLQSDFVRGAFDSYVAEASKNTEAVLKLAGDAAQPLSNRFAVAAEKVKTVA